ncbi:MAG: preprotein translocase subunit YajC [Endomicrobiia bacterium]
MYLTLLYAQECVPASGQSSGGGIASLIPLILIFFIFYFIMILPQQKKMKEHEKMLNELKKGDNVLLSSGIYGTITNIKGNIIELKIAENVKINVLKSTVSQIITEEQNKQLNS